MRATCSTLGIGEKWERAGTAARVAIIRIKAVPSIGPPFLKWAGGVFWVHTTREPTPRWDFKVAEFWRPAPIGRKHRLLEPRGSPISNRRAFFAQCWRAPRTIGAVLPSSRGLSAAMVDAIDFASLRTIVEFGPGTGVMTADIAARLRPTQNYIGIELNKVLYQQLTQRFPQLQFFNDSAVNLTDILRRKGISEIDAVLCGLPWASLPISAQETILGAMLQALRRGGVFVTFAYLQGLLLPGAWALRRRLKANFSAVTTTKIVWWNFPPAFAYVCRR